MKVGTVSKVMLGGNADVSTKSGIIIDADVILGKAEGRTKDLKGLVLSNKLMFGKSVSRAKMATVSGVAPLVLADAISANVVSLIAFGGAELSSLPQGYKQLAYIESTGTQYLDLGIKGNETTKVSVEYRYHTETSASGSGRVFGSRTNSTNNAFAIGTSSGVVAATGNKAFWCYDAQAFFVIDDPTFPVGDWQTVVFSATEHTLNGVSYGNDYNVVEFETPQNLKLFGFDNGGTMGYGIVDISSCKVWDNGVLIRDLVPCKNASNVVGMYDVVNDAFYQNAGTGDFIAGSAGIPTPTEPLSIVCNNGALRYRDTELPAGYRRLEDIIYNNDCYYTITGLRPTGADTLKFSFKCTQAQPACNIVGCYTTSSAQDNLSLYVGYTQSTAKYLRYNGGTYSSWVIADKRYDAQITPTGSIGMETEETWEQKTFTCSVDLNIGTTSTGATSSKFVGVLYGNVEVVGRAKLIPCERVSDGYIGYYDTYTETFYEKAWGTEPTTSGYDYSHYALVAEGTVETINIHTKNLFDASTETINKFINDSGTIVNNNNYAYSDFIAVKPGQTYTASLQLQTGAPAGTLRIHGYNDSQNWVQMLYGTSGSQRGTVTIPSNIKYVRLSWWKDGYADDRQFEQGSTATTYVPYFNGGTATAEMLLKVGDYADQHEIIGGTVTRKVGVKVLDGTEDWAQNATGKFRNDNNYMRNYNNSPVLCTHYEGVLAASTSGVGYGQVGLFASGTQGASPARLVIGDNNYNTTDGFKAFLAAQYAAGTPVIVIYPLKTETTETVTGQPMATTQGTNIAEITQASLDGLELSVTYMAGVDATVEEIEDAQLSPDVDVTIS